MLARPSLIGWFMLLAGCAFAVHMLKYDAQGLRDRNSALQSSINEERLALNMLQAEWVFLSRPERLQQLAQQYLPLSPLLAKEVVTWDALPQRSVQHVSILQQEH